MRKIDTFPPVTFPVFIAVSLQRSYCLLFTNFSRHAIYTVSQNRTQTIATEILSSRPTFNSCIHNVTALCTSTSNVQTAKFKTDVRVC